MRTLLDDLERDDRRDRGIFTPEQREGFARQDAAIGQAVTEIRTETIYVPREDAKPDITRRREALEAQLGGEASKAERRFLRQQAGAYRKAERTLIERATREMNARMIAMIDEWERRLILGGGKVGGE